MKSVITELIFFILIFGGHEVHGSCDEFYNFQKCAYVVTCQTGFDLKYGLDHYKYDEIESTVESSCKLVYAGNGYKYYPIHLRYENNIDMYDNSNSATIPVLTGSGDEYTLNNMVTEMEISNNYNFETIRDMNNLAVLTVTKNSLTVAKLSNIYELPSLVEINLSHNTISDIQYESINIYSRLRKIDLSFNALTKISEAVFVPFKELETLDVSHNYIDTLSLITFDGMKQLLHLNISFNRIVDINSSLFRFTELKLLDLSNNKIEAIKASDFNRLTKLLTLDLNSNFIKVIEKDTFHSMALLNSLYLNNNKLEIIDKDIFNNASYLNNIDMSENSLKALPRGLFKSKHINYFSVINNQIGGSIDKGAFEGLDFVTELDLSRQRLDSIKDYAFNGLDKLEVLLLNDNRIQELSSKCFRIMQSLKRLDLSSNKIANLEFEKDDLINLFSLSLKNNHLIVVKHDYFKGLNSLQFLDLSDNKITQVESNSFQALKELISFEISNNPLSGTIEKSTFDGLNSLPSLDISCTLLSAVKNGSFNGMAQLKNLNISRSKINTLEYNIFVNTEAIETIDLSHNELKEFNINSTELARLDTLYLNNNLIKKLDFYIFQSTTRLTNLALSYNMIEQIVDNTFKNMKYLNVLDISYNSNLKITVSLLKEIKNVNYLDLSGIKTGISFGDLKDITLKELIMSNSSVSDVKTIQLDELQYLETLSLNYNNMSRLETGGFCNISRLKSLDVSHNKITYIQPGVFKDNTMLVALNLSHNSLTTISYGIFRGLINLHTLDISFNAISSLENERFYEVKSLSVLIADHNKIESINTAEFSGTSLTQLSIGENPIPCHVLVNFKRNGGPFKITASRLDEFNEDNIEGVICNKKLNTFDRITNVGLPTVDNTKILLNIRDILLENFKNYQTSPSTTKADEKYLVDITNEIQKSNSNINQTLSNVFDSTMRVAIKNNETNVLLNKILRVLTMQSVAKAPAVQVTKDNATYENLLSYINKLRDDLNIEKSSIHDMEAKMSAVNSHFNAMLLPTEMPRHEKLNASADSTSLFTETCVGLILVILVGFVLFKVYTSGVFVRKSFSISTRELPLDMDSTL